MQFVNVFCNNTILKFFVTFIYLKQSNALQRTIAKKTVKSEYGIFDTSIYALPIKRCLRKGTTVDET